MSLLKLDLVTDLVTSHLALTTPNTPTKPTNPHSPAPNSTHGGGGLPSVGSCSSQPDKKEASFKKRDHYLRVALAITTPLAKQLFPELA